MVKLGVSEVLHLIYKFYGKGLEVVEELPLYIVNNMIEHAIKKETEDKIYSFWLVHYEVAITHGIEPTPYEELYKEIIKNEKTTTRSADEILNEFAGIVELDKKKRGVLDG